MVDARMARRRPSPDAGVGGIVGRRAGRVRGAQEVQIVQYFGGDDDTPVSDMLKATPPPMDPHREGAHVHVSDVISKCLRRIALSRLTGVPMPPRRIFDGQGITFEIGRAIEAYVKRRLRRSHPDKVYAEWHCICQETKFVGVFNERPTKRCPTCGSDVDIQKEAAFALESLLLTGSPDVLMRMEHGAFHITEVKSMAAAMWNELARPLPDHVVQATFYWYILRELGYRVVDKISLLYVNKEFSFKWPYKEFLITPDVDRILGPYLEELAEFVASLQGGPLPCRTKCPTVDAPNAKDCPVRVQCFQRDE